MLDEDEEAAILSNVPNALSLVTEADCPLILTFTKLLSMIDQPHFSRNVMHMHCGMQKEVLRK
jgi:hypothetical protein